MKKFDLLIILLLAFGVANAQRGALSYESVDMSKYNSELKIVTDTLMPANWNNDSVAVYTFTNGAGYVCGINWYLDLAKAQEYVPTSDYNVEGALFLIPGKFDNDTTNADQGGFEFNLWSFANDEPSTVVASKSYTYDDIDTTGYTVCMFDAPVSVLNGESFAVGMDITGFYSFGADTSLLSVFGVSSSLQGNAAGTELAWEMWNDGTWYTILASVGLDSDMAIFPLVEVDNSGIEDMSFVNGIRLSTYPNPAVNSVTFDYEITNASDVSINVIDAKGQSVMVIEEGFQGVGVHSSKADVSSLSEGIYFVAIQAGSSKVAQRIVISR